LRLPPKQPSDDGAEELAWRALSSEDNISRSCGTSRPQGLLDAWRTGLLDAIQMEQFSLHSPSVPANALRKREIAEIFVIEVHLEAMGDNLPAHESHREPVLTVADLKLEAVLEYVSRLGDEQPMPLQLRGCRTPVGRVSGGPR
jgi:hypothetical protein